MIERLKEIDGPCRIEYKYPSANTIISRAYGSSDEALSAATQLESYGVKIILAEPLGGTRNE